MSPPLDGDLDLDLDSEFDIDFDLLSAPPLDLTEMGLFRDGDGDGEGDADFGYLENALLDFNSLNTPSSSSSTKSGSLQLEQLSTSNPPISSQEGLAGLDFEQLLAPPDEFGHGHGLGLDMGCIPVPAPDTVPVPDANSIPIDDLDFLIPNDNHKDPHAKQGWQNTLHLASQTGHTGIFRVLLNHGNTNSNGQSHGHSQTHTHTHIIDSNAADSDGLTPLMHATIHGHASVVALLLSHGASVARVDVEQRSVLHWAVLHRRDGILRTLLEWPESRGLVDGYDSAGRTALHIAVEMGFDAGVQVLLELGANVYRRASKG